MTVAAVIAVVILFRCGKGCRFMHIKCGLLGSSESTTFVSVPTIAPQHWAIFGKMHQVCGRRVWKRVMH